MAGASTGTTELPADCDAQWARGFHERMLELPALDRDIELGGEAVERMTTPAVQVLVALTRALAAERHRLIVRAPSPAVLAAFSDLGLHDITLHWSAN